MFKCYKNNLNLGAINVETSLHASPTLATATDRLPLERARAGGREHKKALLYRRLCIPRP